MPEVDEALGEAADEEVSDGVSPVNTKSDQIYLFEKVLVDGFDDVGFSVY